MNNLLKTVLASALILAVGSTVASADAKKGQKYYLKKLKVCKKDGLKNGAVFATKHDRKSWEGLKSSGKLMDEFKSICPSGVKKMKKMKEKDITNLYDFVWKYASDGEVPSCG
ncbi:cytochrome C [Sulfurimonas aquatica]|uniref:Cytochrome C n=1 Tax=Sulfurimonas aquatica TaxID=2672570 RepID=A0A975AYR6_9BACT|nr:cytochrome C [Sulfurimonas aquatica]QSZ41072.1 cytochrome C [Sulfurimonas aquatica]